MIDFTLKEREVKLTRSVLYGEHVLLGGADAKARVVGAV